jgi:hypothetical protein
VVIRPDASIVSSAGDETLRAGRRGSRSKLSHAPIQGAAPIGLPHGVPLDHALATIGLRVAFKKCKQF